MPSYWRADPTAAMIAGMETPRPASILKPTLATALPPVLWGSTYLLAGEVLASSGPLTLAALRTLPAGLLLVAITRFRLPSMGWRRLLVLSALNITGFQSLLFFAAQRLPGGIAALLGAMQPLVLILLAWGIDKQSPRPPAIVAALLGIAGVRLVVSTHDASYDVPGMIAGFAATLSMAIGTYLSVRWRGTDAPLPLIGWQLLLGGLMLLEPAAMVKEIPAYGSPIQWAGIAYLVLFGTAAAYALWFRGLTILAPVAVSALGLLSPLTALLLGWGFLGESLDAGQIAGVAVVMASVVVMQASAHPMDRQAIKPA